MGFEVVLVCAIFCILQFHISHAESIQLRIPADSINGYSQNPQMNTRVPYPIYREGNFCSGCKRNCGSNRLFRLKSPPNPYVISVPSDNSKSGRLTITIDARKSCDRAKPANNGEIYKQTVDVLVKLVPKNKTQENLSTSTSGKSSATSNKDGNVLTANTDGILYIPGYDKALEVAVYVVDNDSVTGPSYTSLDSKIVTDNGKGMVSETDTQADIKKTPESKSKAANPSDKPVGEPKFADKPSDTPSPNPIPVEKPVPSDSSVGEPKLADKPSDTPSPDPVPIEKPVPSDGSDSPVTGEASNPVTPDDTGSAPADTPTTDDSKTPGPVIADPGTSASPDGGKPSTSSSSASGAIADDKKAATGSTSGSSAASG